jgi:hypothetical protein
MSVTWKLLLPLSILYPAVTLQGLDTENVRLFPDPEVLKMKSAEWPGSGRLAAILPRQLSVAKLK